MKNTIKRCILQTNVDLPSEHSELNIFLLSDDLKYKIWEQNPSVATIYLISNTHSDYLYVYISTVAKYSRITVTYNHI